MCLSCPFGIVTERERPSRGPREEAWLVTVHSESPSLPEPIRPPTLHALFAGMYLETLIWGITAPLYRQGNWRQSWDLSLVIVTPSLLLCPLPQEGLGGILRQMTHICFHSSVNPLRSAGQGLRLQVTVASERLSHQLQITQPVSEELLV